MKKRLLFSYLFLFSCLFFFKTPSLAQTPTVCPSKPYNLVTDVDDNLWFIAGLQHTNDYFTAVIKKSSGASPATGKCYSEWEADTLPNYFSMYTFQMFCNCNNVGFRAYNSKPGCPDAESDEIKVNFGSCICARADYDLNNLVDVRDETTFIPLHSQCLGCTPWTCSWSTCGKVDLDRNGKIDNSDNTFFENCYGSTFCWCTYAPSPTPTPVSIKVEGYKRDEDERGLSGAVIKVQKINNLSCTGNHSWCTPESGVTSTSTGSWTSTCTDGPMKSILIRETANPAGYTDGKDPSVPAGCTFSDKNTVCCNVDGKTSLGGKITFYNKLGTVPTPTPCSSADPTNFSASDGTYADRIETTWSSVAGASGYNIFRKTEGGLEYTWCTFRSSSSTEWSDYGGSCGSITAGTVYVYMIQTIVNLGLPNECSSLGATDTGFRSLPTPTPTPTPIPTATPVPLPWFQVENGGHVTSTEGRIDVSIPNYPLVPNPAPYLINSDPGGIALAKTMIYLGSATAVSPDSNWKIESYSTDPEITLSGPTVKKLWDRTTLMGDEDTSTSYYCPGCGDLSCPPGSEREQKKLCSDKLNDLETGVYFTKDDVVIDDDVKINLTGDKTIILFIGTPANISGLGSPGSGNKDLNIDKEIKIGKDSALILIVSGQIIIDPSVDEIDGLFYSADTGFAIETGTSNQQLIVNGSLLAPFGRIAFQRNLGAVSNKTQPAVKVIFEPKYWQKASPYLHKRRITWEEVAP